ncbi:hypothetical protein [Parabacteroides chinchillae]|uniref:Uncharacterized protein n=1 Tax=Parabacteroides chinchillae TaxID=871327 RepID=A0A8G2BWE5_9BACT|nr:hypothetical protein [Parabacteroides chinchillae]SEF86587.1 hypothetical protein SAMN05444001_108125 [Parabacteroides chinchillae]
MAKYTITCKCGHEITVNIVGKVSEREGKAEYLAGRLCPECYKKEKELSAKELVQEDMNLPELNGSDKQVSWATSIRTKFIETAEELYTKAPDSNKEKIRQVIDLYKSDMLKNTSSSFWIDKRYDLSLTDVAREASKYVGK